MSSLLFFNTSLFEKYILKNYVFKTTFPKFCFKNLHVRSLAAKDDDVLLMDNGVLSLIHNGPDTPTSARNSYMQLNLNCTLYTLNIYVVPNDHPSDFPFVFLYVLLDFFVTLCLCRFGFQLQFLQPGPSSACVCYGQFGRCGVWTVRPVWSVDQDEPMLTF